MSNEEREFFLADVHVGVLGVATARNGHAPLLVPVWYRYTPGGELVVQTGRETVKAQLLRAAGRFSICVQDENPPYRYVSVEGPVTSVSDPVPPAERKAIAHRYLDPQEADSYLAATARQLTDDVAIHMRPQHWRTANFATFAAEFAGTVS
ncbi:pyridoxamine 5'-phosphate oxidase family protein [Kibdelosporangium phytohabitans]|uniref:Pyridoxamine 5'-phosphate oxidase n=1 Tax=Kibdelosporangium phytohabitans TaxID=860235 RepID=A0A0N9I209_9PSEU|nr:pyridoxamine 5'-phosphate oxidase family protein [Kibdelosporangium phytohabitans]ALG09900.1 pyridoxamine 5'-phosphate oxidase [Kibdelosporangium phytohabitans]MBE1468697.1 PPOX class probable F420-dependent enzyme [Kibdelosporangium phytohabitans]